jgi:Uncharacterized protein conserved in bacteria
MACQAYLGKSLMAAALLAAAVFVVASCKKKIEAAIQPVDLNKTPVQVIDNMDALDSDKGMLDQRMAAPRMERYEGDSSSWETFPKGFAIYSYTADGQLETKITADQAIHNTTKGKEEWKAYGHVVVKNFLKEETLETDTLFWDKANERIFTNCYVKMRSPSGFLQGFGMESDQRASNAKIIKPFDSYGYVDHDTSEVIIDPANFIGPIYRPVPKSVTPAAAPKSDLPATLEL